MFISVFWPQMGTITRRRLIRNAQRSWYRRVQTSSYDEASSERVIHTHSRRALVRFSQSVTCIIARINKRFKFCTHYSKKEIKRLHPNQKSITKTMSRPCGRLNAFQRISARFKDALNRCGFMIRLIIKSKHHHLQFHISHYHEARHLFPYCSPRIQRKCNT